MRKQLGSLIFALILSGLVQGCSYERDAISSTINQENLESTNVNESPYLTMIPTPTIAVEYSNYLVPELTILPLEEYDINEILIAIDCGFIPEEIQGDFDQLISTEQFLQLLTQLIHAKGGITEDIFLPKEEVVNEPITRLKASTYLYEAAYAMKHQVNIAILSNYSYDSNAISPLNLNANSFSDIKSLSLTKEEETALNYVVNQCDLISGYRLMEYTPDFRFRPKDALSRAEAILAAYRLYNSIPDAPNMISLEEVSTHTIPEDLLTKDSSLPDLTIESVPSYQGIRLKHTSSYNSLSANFCKTDIEYLAEQGFNFFQAYITASSFAAPYFNDVNPNLINEVCLKQLDQLIAWGIEYDVHINLCIDGLLGHGLSVLNSPDETSEVFLLDDVEALNRTVQFFKLLETRYANVPNEFLSFQLFDQPEFTTSIEIKNYVLPIVRAIRSINPDRVIFYDVMDSPDRQKPLTLLAKERVSFLYSLTQERFENNIATISEFLQDENQMEHSTWSKLLYQDVSKIAQKYNVGFMIHGINTNGLSPLYVEHRYLNTLLDGIHENELGWCFGEFGGIGATVLNGDKYDAEYIWDEEHNWYVDESLLELLKEYQYQTDAQEMHTITK